MKKITYVGRYVTISVFSTFRQVKHKIKSGLHDEQLSKLFESLNPYSSLNAH